MIHVTLNKSLLQSIYLIREKFILGNNLNYLGYFILPPLKEVSARNLSRKVV